jgi:hypothetical protein
MTDYDLSIQHNPDARAWAKFFIETVNKDPNYVIDEEIMIAWFSNAMMAMHDHLLGIKFHNGDHIQYEIDNGQNGSQTK